LLQLPSWLFRGYTGHEHLDVVFSIDIINMNARLYDPVVARMLRWDAYSTSGTQGANRYSYVMNNPLKYTDPTGNWIELAAVVITAQAPAAIGGTILSAVASTAFASVTLSTLQSLTSAGFSPNNEYQKIRNAQGQWTGQYKYLSSLGGEQVDYIRDDTPWANSNPKGEEIYNPYYNNPNYSGFTRTGPGSWMGTERMASGLINATEDPLTMGGWQIAGRLAQNAAQKTINSYSRAFWSGSGTNAAAQRAGFQTLGQTRAAQNLDKMIYKRALGDYYPPDPLTGYPGSEAFHLWGRLSAQYAKGARGTVHVFQNASEGVSLNSIWRLYEYPALMNNPNVTKIIYHTIR
jgi:RHS repeat-associated protein